MRATRRYHETSLSPTAQTIFPANHRMSMKGARYSLRPTTATRRVPHTMGRKKGKQSGNFHRKKLNAEHHHKLYTENASEANYYRNPVSRCVLGKGLGYRNAVAASNDSVGRWDSKGRRSNGDKWSSIFTNRSPTERVTSINTRSRHDQGLAHLRHLLEDRRTEDRFHDRQFRLAVQRSRIRDARSDYPDAITNDSANNSASASLKAQQNSCRKERNEPGWIISQRDDVIGECEQQASSSKQDNSHHYSNIDYMDKQQHEGQHRVPSLQSLAARVLGPLLPIYVAACGHDFIGECLKSASPEILAQLSIALAKSSMDYERNREETIYATTDGVVKALVHSGLASGLVLKGAPLVCTNDVDTIEVENDKIDTRWLSDHGLLALCPRLLPQMNVSNDAYNDDWETLDVDLDLTSRMAGCFHLKRLELIDIPLCKIAAQGGISLRALRHVFQSCPGITHLSLSGCFYNWADMGSMRQASEDVSLLVCGTELISQTSAGSNDIHISELGHFDPGYGCEQTREKILGLHQLLPELQVIDLSHCSWVTPMMILRFLLQCRDRTAKLDHSKSESIINSNCWELKNGDECVNLLSICLRQIGVLGCNLSTADINMIEEWISHSLFGSVKIIKNI